MSIMPMMFSWLRWLRSMISRRMRFASIRSSNARGIFFTATSVFSSASWHEITTPYAPCPTARMNSNLESSWKREPETTNELVIDCHRCGAMGREGGREGGARTREGEHG
jgi:hypothetical protein